MSYKTTIAGTIEAITAHLESLDKDELVNMHNSYCQNQNYSDDEIYNNDEDFFNTFFENRVVEAVRATQYGDYNFTHDYVKFNGYANLESFDYPNKHIDLNAIAEDILESPENYDIELQDCFVLDGITYEGTEEEAKEQYNDYMNEIEEENESLEEGEEETIPDSFEKWVADNIATVD